MRVTDPSRGALLDNLLLESTTDMNGTQAPSSANTVQLINSGRGLVSNGSTTAWNVVGAAPVVLDATRGRRLIELVSGASRNVIHAPSSLGASLGMRFAGTGDPNYALIRPPRRYTWAIPVQATVRGAAPTIDCGLCPTNGLLTTLGTDPGVFWASDPAINAGRWTARYRLTGGGGITTAVDSGVLLDATFHVLGFRYTEGAVPKVEFLLDGVALFTLSGQAALPAAQLTNAYRLGLGQAIGAGSTVRADDAVFRVETLD